LPVRPFAKKAIPQCGIAFFFHPTICFFQKKFYSFFMRPAIPKTVRKRWKALLPGLITGAVLLSPHQLPAQERPLAFEHLTIDDGLSQSMIYCIVQDRKGYMWFGTKDGLNRFDGYEFTVFKNDPLDSTSISGNEIFALYEDRAGHLWVGAANVLNRFDPKTESFHRYQLAAANAALPNEYNINSICEDRQGRFWIGTEGGGLFKLQMQTGNQQPGTSHYPSAFAVTHYTHNPSDPTSLSNNIIYAVLVDRRGTLWAGTRSGLNRLALDSVEARNAFTRYRHYAPEGFKLANEIVFSLHEDSEGAIWMGLTGGLSRFLPEATPQFAHFPFSQQGFERFWLAYTICIAELPATRGENRKLWLGTHDGLAIFDPATATYQFLRYDPANAAGLSMDGIRSLYCDPTGRMWLGTAGKGVNIHDPTLKAFNLYRGPASSSSAPNVLSVRAIFAAQEGPDEVLWIGANESVLYRLHRATGIYERFHLPLPEAYYRPGLLQDRTGLMWFATKGGVYVYDPATKRFTAYRRDPDDPNSLSHYDANLIYEDREGNIWIACQGTINLFHRETGRFTRYHDPQANITLFHCMHRDVRGKLWLGWQEGLLEFDPATKTFRHFRNDVGDSASLSYNTVLSLCDDPLAPERFLWIGTAGGLNRLDLQNEKFTPYTEKEGLPNNVVYAILPDAAGNLWMSTNRGLSKLDPQTGVFKNYNASDGLQSNEFNWHAHHLSQSGEMFFGGIAGLNAFFPAEIKDNPHVPPVVFTGFQIFNRPVSFKEKKSPLVAPIATAEAITLSYEQNVFSFEFAALDYAEPAKNRYRYKMENFDRDWRDNGARRMVTYTNLSPGEYVLRVQGSNNDGVWNETGAAIKITITPPWWQTWWAYLLYLFFAGATLVTIYKTRVRYLKKRAAELEATVVERTAEVVAQKQRIEKQNELLETQAEKLTELDRLKSRFFANISHEFRTPLTLILGPVAQMLGEAGDEKAQSRLRLVQFNAKRLLSLINQLLDLSKLESGRMQLRAAAGDLVEFLQGLTLSFAALAEARGLALRFESRAEKLPAYFDRDKVEKIFNNLLSNAIKFTPEGGSVEVAVASVNGEERGARGERREEKGDERSSPFRPSPFAFHKNVEITIKDTGLGIAAKTLPHVFDRFYQADHSSTREFEGTGIGLALVKELVELHHGKISVTSAEGQGTTFTVQLPLEKDRFAPEEILEIAEQYAAGSAQYSVNSEQLSVISDQPSVSSERVTTNDQQPATSNQEPDLVLLVEDHAEMRRFVRSELEPNYRVLEAGDGEAGWQQAIEAIPDLVISDVMMPKLNGLELCRRLKADERTSHVPVILLTAKADQPDKLAGLELGADDYLSKPFDRHELAARVKNLTAQRRKLAERFAKRVVLKPGEMEVESRDEAFLKKVMVVVEQHLGDENFEVDTLCRSMAMSRAQLHRKLKALVNQSAMELVRRIRLERAADLLRQNAGSIAEIAYQVGFSSQAHFTRSFHEHFGRPPSEYKKAK
jgi:signal transduction histidine kinase/ligand-binding sensor domain-containing protein/DNA-binding NarL/FixJ family response regulator